MCPTEDILLDIDIQNRAQLFDRTAQHIRARHGLDGHVPDRVAERLTEREKLGSTALGQGVAIPHARIPDLQHPVAVFIRTAQPIPFDAPDGKPVGLLFTLLVPEHATQEHLQLLADAARLFCERSCREQLRAAPTPLDIRRVLLDA
ncbi:PTS sugar transporter subunit IIA [Chitinimonas koreensis]|nr:PTS sugar transporter subunit IIA [Chitinimonas koreensis]QNM94718.1 PTS sugar transporter subunit IIA [Chitinimonas koreensis]